MPRALMIAVVAAALVACQREVDEPAPQPATSAPASETGARFLARNGADAPMTEEEIAEQRRENRWRTLTSFSRDRAAAARPSAPSGGVPTLAFRTGEFAESLDDVNWSAIGQAPLSVPLRGDIEGPSVLRAQVMLDRASFSPGVIDGHWGKNTEIAVWWFQNAQGLEPTGEIDEPTFRALAVRAGDATPLRRYIVTAEDVKGPFRKVPEDIYAKAKLDCLCYQSVGELLAEKFHATEGTLARLNGGREPSTFREGDAILVPNVGSPPSPNEDVARLLVSVEGNYFHAYDAGGNILVHAPTTVGSEYDPSPSDTLKVTSIAFDPTFHYQPKLFYEVPDDEPEAMLQPGPNSPVGKVWMQLSRDNYGIHGTSDPASIGYASSHGCIRLTNWTALHVANRTPDGTTVEFTDAR